MAMTGGGAATAPGAAAPCPTSVRRPHTRAARRRRRISCEGGGVAAASTTRPPARLTPSWREGPRGALAGLHREAPTWEPPTPSAAPLPPPPPPPPARRDLSPLNRSELFYFYPILVIKLLILLVDK